MGSRPIIVNVNKNANSTFLVVSIGNIVVLYGIQAKVFDRDIRINGETFPREGNSADVVMPSDIGKTDIEW